MDCKCCCHDAIYFGVDHSAPCCDKPGELMDNTMTYYDRHGTEIREGDCVEHVDKAQRILVDKFTMGRNGDCPCVGSGSCQWAASVVLVVARADGTPVYRYQGGEDVRVGDVYASLTALGECEVTAASAPGEAGYWPTCTLIRRAESEPQLQAHTCACGRRSMLCDEQGRCPDCQNPILGHDRNGKEVRKGAILRAFDDPGWIMSAGSLTPATPHYEPTFVSINGEHCLLQAAAELVDDKAGRIHFERIDPITPDVEHMARLEERERALNAIESACRALAQCKATYHGIPCDGAHRGERLHGFNDRYAPNGRMEWVDPGEELPEPYQIERCCRALAQPTMGERFEAFKVSIGDALQLYPMITAQYDLGDDGNEGGPHPFAIVRFEEFACDVWDLDELYEWLQAMERAIGRSVLSGRAILRGGK